MRGFLFLLFFLLSSFSCSRGAINPKLNMTIGISDGQSGLDANDQLNIVIVNVKVPGKPPIVRQVEYHDGPNVIMGQPIHLEIRDIPNGDGFFIQVLAVYESQTNGAMKFLYGDATANVAGDTTVNITADNVGTSNIMVQVAGRFLTTQSPDTGPTGTLIAQFLPPNGKEPMNVEKSAIVNGWFQAFAIDSATAGFRYVMANSAAGTAPLFDNFTASSPFLTPNAYRLKVIKPVSAYLENRGDGSEVRVRAEAHMYLGYFGVGTSPRKVCYVSTVEALGGAFTATDLATPLEYMGTGATVTKVRVAGGGVGDSYSVFADAGGACSAADLNTGAALLFLHNKSADEKDYAGFSVPFKSLRPLDVHRSYLDGQLDVSTPANPVWNLKWKYLAGASDVLAGTEIFYKYSSGGGDDGGGGEEMCESLPGRGYQYAGFAAAPAETYAFTGNGMIYDNVNPSNSNVRNYRFAACAYRIVGGVKQYLGRYIQADCMGGSCGSMDHFGWGINSATPLNMSWNMLSIGGSSQRILNVATTANYTTLSVNNTTGFVSGQEVLVLISGASNNNTCGTYQGEPLQPGKYAFTRLLTNSPLKVAKGTFVDVLGTGALSNSTDSTNFCYVQVVGVPHFRDLDLTGSLLTAPAFDYAGSGGGVVALRVNGTLNIGGSGNGITVTAKGYPGGANTIPNGGGIHRAPSDTSGALSNNSGGTSGIGASGGGGYGNGGNAGSGGATPGGSGVTWGGGGGYFLPRLIFGGGGVGVGAPGLAGAGGGLVFIMARKIVGQHGTIEANGMAGPFYSGGGGGSINVITRELTGLGSGSIQFQARGADGDTSSGSYGGGGGGSAEIVACQNDLSGGTSFLAIGGSGGGTTVLGGNGANGTASYIPSQNFWMCR